MPLPDNGGALAVLLILIGIVGLAMLTRYATPVRCGACRRPIGDRPQFWVLNLSDGTKPKAPSPRCRACFAAGR